MTADAKATPIIERRSRLCWPPRARRCMTRSKARSVSGCHCAGGARLARRSLTHRSSDSLEIWLAIAFHIFLSERFLCAAQQRSHGCLIQLKDSGDLLITQSFAAQNQKLGIARFQCSQHNANLVPV